jgi:tripartite-type tricarboxylate transporter receptor subunit TctC
MAGNASAFALAAGLALAAASGALAQKYPEKPVRMIVPFAPGGGTDVLARFLGTKLSENLGVSVVVDNRAGASGTIGAEAAARSAPDGHTVLFTSASFVFNPSLYRIAYDPVKDFSPVTLAALVPHLLVVHPSLPVRNVKELIALAKKHPGEVFFASGGVGSSVHLAAALFIAKAGVKMTHVPYKGGGPAMIGLMSGEASVMFPTMQSAMPHVRSGRLRPIAISIARRSPALPDVPTVAESGLPGYDATGWYGMLAPAGTPRAAIERLHGEIVKILSVPETRRRLASEGAEAVGSTPEEFARFVREELAKWAEIIRGLGLRSE